MNLRRSGVLAAAVLVVAMVGGTPVSLARFTSSRDATSTFVTATIAPPANLSGTGGATASLAWTASTSTSADGYDVLRSVTSGSGYTKVGTVTPVTASSTVDTPAPGTWYYVLRTRSGTWTSENSNEAAVVVGSSPVTTGLKPCASSQAETSSAGDNDGYEADPGNACGVDGLVAADVNSGQDTTSSCTSNAKDKHQFWGYAFDLPATASSIVGITVQPVVGMNNNGGTSWLCIQLSPDGGATWSAPKSVDLADRALTTYALGGATDTWGRTWALSELGATNLRVRVIDSSTKTGKDFYLDGLGVSVTYTP